MALAVAPATSLFGNNFKYDNYSSPHKPLPQEIIQQYPSLSAEVLELYEQYNYIHKKMRKKEIRQQENRMARTATPHAHARSSDAAYQAHRSATVDWVASVAQALALSSLTLHSAVAFMDDFVDCVAFDASRLQLVAAASLLISAKVEEQEPNVPRVAVLHSLCMPSSAPASFIPKVEGLILNHLNWEMVVVTPLHFLEYYLLVSLLPSEVLANPHLPHHSDAHPYLAKMVEFLVEMCQHHTAFRAFRPSIVAAAAISLGRAMLRVVPAWSPSLSLISGLSHDDFISCQSLIQSHYLQSFAPLC